MAAAMTGLAVLIIANAAAAVLVFMAGHKGGRRSCRNEYPDGWDGGVAAERERWEQVTGATYDRLAAGVASDVPDLPGNDGWPYLFTNLRGAGERRGPPSFAEVMADADTRLGNPPRGPDAPPTVPAVTAVPAPTMMKTGGVFSYSPRAAAHTLTGVVVKPSPGGGPGPDPAADWDLLAGAALPDYAAAALGGHRTVDECVDSIVLRAVGR